MSKPESSILAPLERKPSNLWADAWRRLVASNGARVGAAIAIIFILTAILAPLIAPYDPTTDRDLVNRLKPPSWAHPFGTDDLGRDVFVRVVYGSQISLRVGIVAVGIAMIFGTLLGMVAGYVGGKTDTVIMRLMDVMLAFPSTLLAIAIVAMRGPGIFNTMLAVGTVRIPIYARIARSTVLSIKQREYITAAHAVGSPGIRILFAHVLPNSLSPIIVQATLGIATALLDAAALGFLGLGAQPPAPEWGAMLSQGYQQLFNNAAWVVFFPGIAIMLTVLGFNLLGDGLRDALDPQMRGRL
jgi:peptide/nickel transport system permease protein